MYHLFLGDAGHILTYRHAKCLPHRPPVFDLWTAKQAVMRLLIFNVKGLSNRLVLPASSRLKMQSFKGECPLMETLLRLLLPLNDRV